METRGAKRPRVERARIPLDLDRFIPLRDVRKLVWRYLTPHDREMIRCAQNSWHAPFFPVHFMEHCAAKGYAALLQFGCRHGLKLSCDVMWHAAKAGRTDLIELLCLHYADWRSLHVCSGAAIGGHLPLLQWARAKGCPWNFQTPANAAFNGHMHVLQWIHSEGCERSEPWICASAAQNGHLDVLKWLRANGYPWDEDTCSRAASGGHLSVLQWARANGCPWDRETCDFARTRNHLHVLQWARANGCPE